MGEDVSPVKPGRKKKDQMFHINCLWLLLIHINSSEDVSAANLMQIIRRLCQRCQPVSTK